MPDYAADLSVPILDRCRNAKEEEIGSSTMCRHNYYFIITVVKKIENKLNHFLIQGVMFFVSRVKNV